MSAARARGSSLAARLADRGVLGLLATVAVCALAVSPAGAEPLARFHERLARLESGEVRHVHVLQIGDSHTAGDHFTGRLRALLQRRFGNGGRGFLPPGVPHEHYRPQQVGVSQSGGWRLVTSNRADPEPLPYGLAGLVMRARGKATMTFEDRTGTETAWLEAHFLTRPDGGTIEALVDGVPFARFATREHSPALIRVEGRGRRIELRALGDGAVDLAGLRHVANDAGVVVSNLGFIGAQVAMLGRWHWPSVRQDIAALDPALVILAFGTNEGFAPAARMAATYERELSRRLQALRDAAPSASLVVVGAPDANRYPRFCLPPPKVVWDKLPESERREEPPKTDGQGTPADGTREGLPGPSTGPGVTEPHGGKERDEREAGPMQPGGERGPRGAVPPDTNGAPGAAPGETARDAQPRQPSEPTTKPGYRRRLVWADPPADTVCRPLDPEERQRYDVLIEEKDRRLCRWHTPAAIAIVQRVQREVAARHDAFFFDWGALFEGECGADRWARNGLAHKDRVHFKPEGYAVAADRLHAALLAGYGKAR